MSVSLPGIERIEREFGFEPVGPAATAWFTNGSGLRYRKAADGESFWKEILTASGDCVSREGAGVGTQHFSVGSLLVTALHSYGEAQAGELTTDETEAALDSVGVVADRPANDVDSEQDRSAAMTASERGDADDLRFELWVGGYHYASFDTLREAERGAAERPPTQWAEIVEMPAEEDPWRPGDGEPTGDVVRQYPEVVGQ